MTQPNQSELTNFPECECCKRQFITGGNLCPKCLAYITANYTRNSTVESLSSQIACLNDKVEGMREEVAERERVARIDELNRLMDYTDENEIVCVCEQASVQVCDHNWSLCHIARARIAELEMESKDER